MRGIALLFSLTAYLVLVTECSVVPLPQAKLDSALLEYYKPLVLNDIKAGTILQDDGNTRRATREYGFSFFRMEKGDFSFTEPPEYLIEIGKAICEALGDKPIAFTNIILSLYGSGYHLEPHADVAIEDLSQYGFYFSEKVYGIIIEADSDGHFYLGKYGANGRMEPATCLEEVDGTVFSLQGLYRHLPYLHGVTTVAHRRVSITFRTVFYPNMDPLAADACR